MKHGSYEAQCHICRQNAGEVPIEHGVIFENDLWLVRHTAPPYPLVGWTLFHTQRHVQGPAHFNDVEARSFGPALRHVSKTIEEVTGVPRVYMLAFGESTPHMHAHLVPRYGDLPAGAPWNVADIYRAVSKREQPSANPAAVEQIVGKLRSALAKNPPPR